MDVTNLQRTKFFESWHKNLKKPVSASELGIFAVAHDLLKFENPDKPKSVSGELSRFLLNLMDWKCKPVLDKDGKEIEIILEETSLDGFLIQAIRKHPEPSRLYRIERE